MKSVLKGKVLAVGTALLLTVAGCTSATNEDAATSSPVPSVTATASFGEAAFGEWVTLAEGVGVMVLPPQDFTPSDDIYAQPIWGPVELREWDHFMRTTVTVRNESGRDVPTPMLGVDPQNGNDGQMIVDEASGIMEQDREGVQDGQQGSYDAAFGIEDPDGAILLGIAGIGDFGAGGVTFAPWSRL